jgi:hypothetical protein
MATLPSATSPADLGLMVVMRQPPAPGNNPVQIGDRCADMIDSFVERAVKAGRHN